MRYVRVTLHRNKVLAALTALFFCIVSGDSEEMEQKAAAGMMYEVKLNYPRFSEPALDSYVDKIVQQTLKSFNKKAFPANATPDFQSMMCTIEAGSAYIDDMYISFLLTVYQYETGGPHGSTTLIPITYSKKNKKMLSLKEAIKPVRKDWLSALSAEARRLLNAQRDNGTLLSDSEWIERGTEAKEQNFSVFKLEKDAIRIIFPQYQVAPYSSGMPEIVIPYTFFK